MEAELKDYQYHYPETSPYCHTCNDSGWLEPYIPCLRCNPEGDDR